MNFLSGFHGGIAIALICALLFIEEAGIPVPFAPGDALLIAAGVLASNDQVLLWVFLPLAFLACIAGALTAYSWSRLVGAQAIGALVRKFGATRMFERVTARLQSAGPIGIATSRLIPGMRINTTLVAGAAGISLPTFVAGLLPATLVWVVGFTLLGMVVGIPAQHFLGRLGHLALEGAILLATGLAGYVALTRIPAAQRVENPLLHSPRPERFALALLVDLCIIASVVSGLAALLRAGIGIGDIDGFADVVSIIVVGIAVYTVVSRRGPGRTGGEALLDVNYPRFL